MTVCATAKRRRKQAKQSSRHRVRSGQASKARNERLNDKFNAMNKRKGSR